MSGRMASFWLRAAEVVVAALALMLPLAFFLRSYDAMALKTTLFEAGTLALLGCWLAKGFERGRWELPAQAVPMIVPAAALAAWALARFASSPAPLAALPGLLRLLLGLAAFAVALLECGGARPAQRAVSWLLAAGWFAALYGLAQRAGFDPLPWKGAFGARSFATLGSPDAFGLFAALCAPAALARLADPERDAWAKRADAALLCVLGAAAAASGSPAALVALAAGMVCAAAALPAFLPSRGSLKTAAAGLLVAAAAAALWAAAPGAGDDAAAARALRAAQTRLVLEKPVVGHGPGRFALALDQARPAALVAALGHDARPERAAGQLAELLVELGIVGAALWLWLLAAVLAGAWRAGKACVRRGALAEGARLSGLLGALAALTAGAQWANAAGETPWLWWPLAGLAGGLSLLAGRGAVRVLPVPLFEPARRKLSAASLLAALALAVVPLRWQAADVALNEAVAAARRGAYGEAARLAQDAQTPGAPHRLEARYVEGQALLAADRPTDALDRFAALESEAPAFAQLQYLKGRAFSRLGAWELAQASFERQYALDPTFVPNLEGLTVAAREAGDLARARQAALASISLDPEDPLKWFTLSTIYQREKNVAEARRAHERAARLRRSQPRPSSKPARSEG